MKVVSLFAGCGGLDLGLIKAGHNVVLAHDIDTDCKKTYEQNIGSHFVLGDVKELKAAQLPKYDLLTGGFPCQGFSIANIFRHVDDKRNELYLQIVRLLRETRPKYFLAENVPGLLSLAKGKILEMIIRDFSTIDIEKGFPGYEVHHYVLNAIDYGVPQNRKRVIFVGVSNKLSKKDRELLFSNFPPPPTHGNSNTLLKPYRTIRDAIGDLPDPDSIKGKAQLNHYGTQHKVKINGYIGNRRLDWDKPAPTIVGRGGGTGGPVIAVHPDCKRRFTVRETARFQTFPDDFEFYGSTSSQFRQIGNAVAVNFAYHLGKVFKDFEDGKLKHNKKVVTRTEIQLELYGT